MNLEGIVSKMADAPYRSGRTKTWLKSKTGMGQEFIIIGWRPSDVAGRPFSSLLLAVREGEHLRYAGRVGSGFGEPELAELWPELEKRRVKTPPVDAVPRERYACLVVYGPSNVTFVYSYTDDFYGAPACEFACSPR